jgi:hypothetical protein
LSLFPLLISVKLHYFFLVVYDLQLSFSFFIILLFVPGHVDIFFGALYACVEVRDFHVLFSGFLDKAAEMVGMGATGVHSERHDLNLHYDRVVANGTDLGAFQSARYFHTSGLSFVYLQESLNNVFL